MPMFRPPPAAARRRGLFRLLETLGEKAAQIRQRHLGISQPAPHSYAFHRDVLGWLPAARGNRQSAWPRRPGSLLERGGDPIHRTPGKAWNSERGAFTAFGSDDLDASALLCRSGRIEADDPSS
jgi:hypothetical protein